MEPADLVVVEHKVQREVPFSQFAPLHFRTAVSK